MDDISPGDIEPEASGEAESECLGGVGEKGNEHIDKCVLVKFCSNSFPTSAVSLRRVGGS